MKCADGVVEVVARDRCRTGCASAPEASLAQGAPTSIWVPSFCCMMPVSWPRDATGSPADVRTTYWNRKSDAGEVVGLVGVRSRCRSSADGQRSAMPGSGPVGTPRAAFPPPSVSRMRNRTPSGSSLLLTSQSSQAAGVGSAMVLASAPFGTIAADRARCPRACRPRARRTAGLSSWGWSNRSLGGMQSVISGDLGSGLAPRSRRSSTGTGDGGCPSGFPRRRPWSWSRTWSSGSTPAGR